MHAHSVCPSLSLDNGNVNYSQANRDIGSVATYTCNPGYQLTSPQPGMTRTCSVNGWSNQPFTCERQCEYILVPCTWSIIVIAINNYYAVHCCELIKRTRSILNSIDHCSCPSNLAICLSLSTDKLSPIFRFYHCTILRFPCERGPMGSGPYIGPDWGMGRYSLHQCRI